MGESAAIFFNQIKYHGCFFFSVYHNVQNRTLISLDMLPPISENGPKHPPSCLRHKPRSHPDSSLSLRQKVLASPPPEQMLNPFTFHYCYHLSNTSHHVCGSVKEVFIERSKGGYYLCVFYSQVSGNGLEALVDQKDTDGQLDLTGEEQRRDELAQPLCICPSLQLMAKSPQ